MHRISAEFQLARHRTFILTAAALAMMFIWAFLRMPDGNLLIAVFAFLSAVRLAELKTTELRLRVLAGMIIAAAVLQYIISATHIVIPLNILLPAAASYFILKNLPAASAHPALLTGFLAYTAPPGALAAANRVIDILIAGSVALTISYLAAGNGLLNSSDKPGASLSVREAFTGSLTILCAVFLYHFLSMKQGIWIILTIIFINLSRKPGECSSELIRQRIFSVPLGIMLGGMYSATAVSLDYRLAYLMILPGALGFFMLYYRHDFFSFSLFFMCAFTVYADWTTGTFREFHFLQLLSARSLATVIGAALLLFIEKITKTNTCQKSAT